MKRAERNAEIERLHLEELWTMERIGWEFRITKERVRQVLRARGVTPKMTEVVGRIRAVERFRCAGCGMEEWRYGVNANLPDHCSYDCAVDHGAIGKGRLIPEEDLVDELLGLALELGHTPGIHDMNSHGAYSHTAYTRRFGSWCAACEAAGLVPNERGGWPGYGPEPLPGDLAPYAEATT